MIENLFVALSEAYQGQRYQCLSNNTHTLARPSHLRMMPAQAPSPLVSSPTPHLSCHHRRLTPLPSHTTRQQAPIHQEVHPPPRPQALGLKTIPRVPHSLGMEPLTTIMILRPPGSITPPTPPSTRPPSRPQTRPPASRASIDGTSTSRSTTSLRPA